MTTATLPTYRILGSTGLRVFPISLGCMGFGEGKSELFESMGIGSSEEESEKVFLKYLEAGGNFIGM
jgi:aryl-alcohol dehydrogenase-like predicted oxidoreductase